MTMKTTSNTDQRDIQNRLDEESFKREAYHSEMFDTMIHNSPVGMYIWEGSSFSYVNKQLCELTGYTEEEFLSGGATLPDLIHPDDLQIVQDRVNARIQGHAEASRYRVRVSKKDGTLRHAEVHASKTVQNGKTVAYGTIIDVTEQVTAEIQLQENQEQFQSLFYNNPDAIFKFDLDGQFIDVNPGCAELIGYSVEKLLEMSFAPLVVSEDLPTAFNHFQLAAEGASSRYELSVMRADGKRRNLEVTNFPMKQHRKITGVYGIAKDITEKIKHQKLMEEMVYFDSLTKLPNRKLFEDRLNQVLNLSKMSDNPVAVLFLDLDRFKFINDSLGHHSGDEFLKMVAQRLLMGIRKTDTVGRFAGDEFAILMPDVQEEEAVSLAKRLNAALAEPFKVNGHSLSVSASIGIAFNYAQGESVDSLIKKADMAMYYTKKLGKNNYTVYTTELDQESAFKLTIEKGLKSAIQNDEFVLHYQPIMDLKTGKVSSMEALIRWHHPELGLVPPDRFIPVSEESGYIVPIGEWVFRTACLQNKAWQTEGYQPFKISVNVSTIQLQQPNFVQIIKEILEETGLAANWVELEVTESILMEDTEMMKKRFKNLKALGVSIAIDDFGTGYTSLSYLREFEFDRVKIDRSFIGDINNDLNGKAITSTIIALAHKLNMGVIAEGIEDDTQLSFLSDERCDEGQGYLFSRPMPAEQLQLLLSSQEPDGEQ
jgi:diguanylate cyclase (GGDEF)-like protein/PAS domain S-box-containing protein